MDNSVSTALIGLGANLPSAAGDPAATLRAALRALGSAGVTVAAVSRFYATPAFPPGSGPEFVNAAARVETALPPGALLARLHAVEAGLGRVRGARWAARAIDIDLLAMDDRVLPDAREWRHWAALDPAAQQRAQPGALILPHPRLQDRGFVLLPLAEIAADWQHPVLGHSVAELAAMLPAAARAGIRALA